jgi:hypothetical protein
MRIDYKLNFSIEFTYLKSHGGGPRGDRELHGNVRLILAYIIL